MVERVICPVCRGTGQVITADTMEGLKGRYYGPCPRCKGEKVLRSDLTSAPEPDE